MTKLTLPLTWLDTMARVRGVLPSAFLAGGALRDLDNGREVKDLDVFFTEEAYDLSALDDGLAKQGYFFKSRCAGQYMTGAAGEVDGTTVYVSTEGLPELNLIQLQPGFNSAAIIDRVDFGLCQIGFDALGVITTPAYGHDKLNQRLTLTRADSVEGVVRSLKRYDRLSQKYQGWQLEWGAEFDALVQEAMKRRDLEQRSYTVEGPLLMKTQYFVIANLATESLKSTNDTRGLPALYATYNLAASVLKRLKGDGSGYYQKGWKDYEVREARLEVL